MKVGQIGFARYAKVIAWRVATAGLFTRLISERSHGVAGTR